MATASGPRDLPAYIRKAWRLQRRDGYLARPNGELDSWTVSSLVEAHLKTHLDHYYQHGLRDAGKIPSLSSMSAGKIIEMLDVSDNVEADLRTIVKSINSVTLRQILKDPRTPYPTLRAFLATTTIADSATQSVDIDEAVIDNENYIRSRGGEENCDGKFLVTLEDLSRVVGAPSPDPLAPLRIVRKDPPKGGLEILDERRQRTIEIQPNDAVFARTFERITKGTLRGLDWSNVFVAGGIVVTTLLHTTRPTQDDDKSVQDCDVDVYLYGLGPEEANRKVEEIYEVWRSNLPPTNRQQLVVKNHKTILFLSDYPNRRIRIILKLLSSPTQALLNFDLDACAVGFDGSRVLMLPRCARAIETGYSTFTMDLIFGHPLAHRRATQENQLFRYADQGFGLRILPSYVVSLEEDNIEKYLPNVNDEKEAHCPFWQKSRKPQGAEPGLKTLRRIAYLGQNYTQRFYFGATPVCTYPGLRWLVEEEWKSIYDTTLAVNNSSGLFNHQRRNNDGDRMPPPYISIHEDLPGDHRAISGFELFMRHCEAWRLHACNMAVLDYSGLRSVVYDSYPYDDIPQYKWDASFDTEAFARSIDSDNNELFEKLKVVICQKLHIPYQGFGYANYLTRRIRRQVYGLDLASAMEKQITAPVLIPHELELHVRDLISHHIHSILPNPTHLIPVHDPTRNYTTNALLPSLSTTATDESGNLKYVVITNESMWAGQHRVLDEISEIYWILFQWLNKSVLLGDGMGTQSAECVFHVADALRGRLLPEFIIDDSAAHDEGSKAVVTKSGLPIREALLFRAWAFCTTRPRSSMGNLDPAAHQLFQEEAILYPFPDELFWHDGLEGDGLDEDGGVARWEDVASSSTVGEDGPEDCRAG